MTAEAEADELITLDEVASAGRTALYRLYNVAGEVIYIGISDDPVGRMYGHAREQPWWDEVADKTAVWYQTRAAAEVAETIAVGLEQPKYNKAKRYVRLPEQAFPAARHAAAPRAAGRARVTAAPQELGTAADPAEDRGEYFPGAHVSETSPPELKARVKARWLAGRDEYSDVPNSWPRNMWCRIWFEAYMGEAFRDVLKMAFCERGDSLSRLRDHLQVLGGQERLDETAAWFEPGNPRAARGRSRYERPWTAHAICFKPPTEIMQDTQRRFLFALQRAGRCTEFQMGCHAWAAGFGSPDEAQAAGAVMAEIARGPKSRLPKIETTIAAIRAARMRPELYGCPTCGACEHDDATRVPACPQCRTSMVFLVDRWTPRPAELAPPWYVTTWEFPPFAEATEVAKAEIAAHQPRKRY